MGILCRKLLVLDVNGLLIDTYYEGETRPDHPHDEKVNKFYVYKRPFCDEFVHFCLENFAVGVWSSALEHNVLSLVEYVFKERKENLAFIWHQRHCTDTGIRHPDNKYKPLFLKELWRLWKKYDRNLPWSEGDFGPSNTLLVDDSAYKAINNPPHTAIFPKTYKATDLMDNYLDGELRTYLEGLLESADVQAYLQGHPIGEPSISAGDPQWSDILNSVKMKMERELQIAAHLVGTSVAAVPEHILSLVSCTKTGNSTPMNAMPHINRDSQVCQIELHDIPNEHLEFFPKGQGNRYSRIFPPGWAGPARVLQPRPGEHAYLVPNHMRPSDWRIEVERFPNACHQGLDHSWEHREFGPQWVGHGSLVQEGWGREIHESDTGPRWYPEPWLNESVHLVGNSLRVVPGPTLSLDWRMRAGNQRSDPSLGAETCRMPTASSIPCQFHGPRSEVDRGDSESHPRECADHSVQEKACHESESLGMSCWVGALSDSDAQCPWPARPELSETSHDPTLASDRRRRPVEDRLNHGAAETVQVSNRDGPNLSLACTGVTQSQRDAVQDGLWEHADHRSQQGDGHKSVCFSQSGLASGFAASDGGRHKSFHSRSGETFLFVGDVEPHSISSSEKKRRARNKLPSLLNERLGESNGESLATNPGMLHIRGDAQTHKVLLEGRPWELHGEVMKQKFHHESDRFSPSEWSPSRRSPSKLSPFRSSYTGSDAGSSRASRKMFNESGYVGKARQGLAHATDWPIKEGKTTDESGPTANGRLVTMGSSNTRICRDAQINKFAYDDILCKSQDCVTLVQPHAYQRGNILQSVQASRVPDFDPGFSSSAGPRSHEIGHGLPRKSQYLDYPSEQQSGGKLGDYESTSIGGGRTHDDYQEQEVHVRKRAEDSEAEGRNFPVEHKEFHRRRSRDPHRGGARALEETHQDWPTGFKDSTRCWSAETTRDGARIPFNTHDQRAYQVNVDRSRGMRRGDRGRTKDYQGPDDHHHWNSPGHDHRKESHGKGSVLSRDSQKHFVVGEYYGDRSHPEDMGSWGWAGERDHVEGYYQPGDFKDDWNQSRSSKRRVFF